ncbi:hypothetical protein K2173_021749 [Erythroxylum novogranatense]|uniref:Cytochrome P450 n=1 Tax=Erythroxylum novogranatense TaxID=1862640 RepID=A0AAV8TY62_9ROSI|nr:hypothetical protein K2173_021749 [Erythroxylum novogranatense]
MELFLQFSITFLIAIVSIPFAILLVYNHKSNDCLPPGKMGFPLLGETLEFLSTGRRGNPEKFILDRVAKYSSLVFRTSLLGFTRQFSSTVLCGAAGNKFLFSNEGKLVTVWWPSSVNKIFPTSTKTSPLEESKKLRKLMLNFFKPGALHGYVGMMDTIAQRHFESSWEGKQEITMYPLAKMFTFWVACKLFLSIDDPKEVTRIADPFQVLTSGVFSVPVNLPGTAFNRAIKASNWIRNELLSIVKKRKVDLAENRATATQDILSHMLVTSDEDGQFMTETDIADKILGLLIGGHDTSSAVISFIVKYLAHLPHIYVEALMEQMEIAKSKKPGELLNWDDIQKMKYSWNVACEVLRLNPPLQGTFREATTDFVFSGFSIPKGWKLYWSANSTHKDPQCFPEPEKFDPSRFEGAGPAPYTFVPFGGGPKMCPGKEYARIEILVFMHNVLKRFRWESLISNEKIIVDPIPIPEKGLPIRLIPHHNCN